MQVPPPPGKDAAAPCNADGLFSSFCSGTAVAKVSDFGLSKRIKTGEEHLPHVQQGTLFFAAPELAQGGQLHEASDVYSFGVIMWELMMGCPVSVESCAPPAQPTDCNGRI